MSRLIRRAVRWLRSIGAEPEMPRPGWYPIEDGARERWHDNYGWSEHYRTVHESERPARAIDAVDR